ncbi:hypothetical protein CAPTEDRAFT_32170, partial [Capitella teleta]
GVEYDGLLTKTISGKECQRWDSQIPHAHSYNTRPWTFSHQYYTHNYCRNPSNDPLGPWCLTTDPDVVREYCYVLYCSPCDRKALNEIKPKSFKTDHNGQSYDGMMRSTPGGRYCQSWNAQYPHIHEDYGNYNNWQRFGGVYHNENFCRNPDPVDGNGPWCYTLDPNVRYEYCT